jgi:hypothetical protein
MADNISGFTYPADRRFSTSIFKRPLLAPRRTLNPKASATVLQIGVEEGFRRDRWYMVRLRLTRSGYLDQSLATLFFSVQSWIVVNGGS